MNVADLAAHLRLDVNKSSFAQGEKLIHAIHHVATEFFAFEAVKRIGEYFAGIVEGAMGSAHSIEVLSQQIGIATGPLQELEYAAKASGSSTEALTTGVSQFARVIGEANRGSAEAKKTLSGLGKETNKLLTANAPLEDVLGAVAEQFHSMPDGTKKTALAMQVFGRGGREMIPFLNRGKEGLADLRKEFVELGGELDAESIKKLNELHESTIKLGTAWDGIKNQIAIALVPTLQQMAESVLEWVKANQELIKVKIHEYIAKAVSFLREFWDVLKNRVWPVIVNDIVPAIMTMVHAAEWLTDKVGGAGNAVKILMGAFVVSKLAGFAVGLLSIVRALGQVAGGAGAALSAMGNLAKAGGGLAGGPGGLLGGLGAAGGLLGAGFAGYAAGDWLSHKLGYHKGDAGYNDDYTDPLYAAQKRKNAAARRAGPIDLGVPSLPAGAGTSVVNSPTMHAEINITVPAGADGKEIGRHVKQAISDHWNEQMRDTHAAVGTP